MPVAGSRLTLDVLDVVSPERERAEGSAWRNRVDGYLYYLAARNEYIRDNPPVLQDGHNADNIHRMLGKRPRFGRQMLGKRDMSRSASCWIFANALEEVRARLCLVGKPALVIPIAPLRVEDGPAAFRSLKYKDVALGAARQAVRAWIDT